jgi:FkbM family methyltransferase
MNNFLHISDILSLTAFEFESICRDNAGYAYLGNNTSICRILGKYKIYVDTRDVGITPHLVMDGFWETWLTQCLFNIIKPGDVCIDVGANYGYYSVLMSLLTGKEGRTIAIEPNPNVYSLLQSTANIHSAQIETVQLALSDRAGRIVLNVPEHFFGDASIIQRKDKPNVKTSRVKVKTQTLDGLVNDLQLKKIDVVKIDVEGVEPEVFTGMTQTTANNPGLRVILEYSPFLYADAKQFTEYLFYHFTVHRIKDVAEIVTLTESDIPELLSLTDHTDLFLQKKGSENI